MAVKQTSSDPRELYEKPPFPEQEQEYPGLESDMDPSPEYGKEIYTGSEKLEGKVALITGGDSGIGRAIATCYAKEGADIIISYISEDSDAEVTKEAVEQAGKSCITIAGDIGDEEQCKSIVQRAVDEFGKVDILVNNAAYQKTISTITDYTAEHLDRFWHSNINPLFYFCKAALPHMKPGSSIINTTSIQAYQPSPTLLAYAITKGAILNFTRGFAKEAIQYGIRVNAVAPGPVWTPLIPSTMSPSSTKKFGAGSLLGRPAQPIELAPIYVFLASNDASYITGQTYGATGSGMP